MFPVQPAAAQLALGFLRFNGRDDLRQTPRLFYWHAEAQSVTVWISHGKFTQSPKSDQPAQCELETLDARSHLAPVRERSHITLVNVTHRTPRLTEPEDTVPRMTREL